MLIDLRKMIFLIALSLGFMRGAAISSHSTPCCFGEETIFSNKTPYIPACIDENETSHASDAVPKPFLDGHFAPYYFRNLAVNFGHNAKGSCSYVASEMLLSYYDTYWNDGIIPDALEASRQTTPTTSALDAQFSPGCLSDYDVDPTFHDKGMSNEVYLEKVKKHDGKTVHLSLLNIGIEKYGIYKMEERQPCGTNLATMKKIIHDFLDTYSPSKSESLAVKYESFSVTGLRSRVVKLVRQGTPVVVAGFQSNTSGHAFVVYDYDETNDNLYLHDGWGDGVLDSKNPRNPYACIPFNDFAYSSKLTEILYFEPRAPHVHSDAYQNEKTGERICPCRSVIPTKITPKLYCLDSPVSFKWNSLIEEKWFTLQGLTHEVMFQNDSKRAVLSYEGIDRNGIIVSAKDFSKIVDLPGRNYYLYVGLKAKDGSLWDDYWYSELLSEPEDFGFKQQIRPSDWGFAGRYYFENELYPSSLASEPERKRVAYRTPKGFFAFSERLRTGYIENSYVVLSPRREGAGEAYFQLTFTQPIYSFMYGICLWSSSELLDGSALLKVRDDHGNWTLLTNLLADIKLTTRAEGLKRYAHYFETGIYGIRFESTATATGNRNKGRLCIDDIVLCDEEEFIYNLYPNLSYEKTRARA